MRKEYFHTIILSLLLVTILSSSIYSNENENELNLELSKPAYLLHEPIWLDITFTNSSSDTLRTHGLRYPNHRQFTIDLKDNNGNSMEYTGFHYMFGAGPGEILLEAGEQDYGSFDLLESFGSASCISGYSVSSRRFPCIPKGTYTVQVHFEGVSSKELTFNIVEPGGEEIAVLELVEEASGIWVQDNTEPSGQAYQEVVDKFPNSVFVEQCFHLSLLYTHMDEMRQGTYDERVMKREMLMNYPNSGNSKYWFLSITREFDDDQKITFLNKLLKDHPNTRFSRYAPQLRKRILDKKEGE